MAKLKDITNPKHREAARLVPQPVRSKLHPQEFRLRAKHIHLLTQSMPSGSNGAPVRAYRQALAGSLPVLDFIQRHKQINDLAGTASGTLDNDGNSPRSALRASAAELDKANPYPGSFLDSVRARIGSNGPRFYEEADLDDLLGRDLPENDEKFAKAAAAEDAAWKTLTAGLNKGTTRGHLVKRADLVKSAQAEVKKVLKSRFNATDLDKAISARQAEIDGLRAEILKFKLGENEKAARAGAKPPFPEIAKEAHAPVYKAQATELRAKVRRLGEMSKDVSLDPDLRAYYHTKFEEAEKELTSFLRTNTEGK